MNDKQRVELGDNSAAELVGGYDDLILEILVRSPAKSLIRFKLASKHWFSLISHPEFARSHTLRNPSSSQLPSGLLFYDSLTKSRQLERVSFIGIHRNQTPPSRPGIPSLEFLDDAAGGASIKVVQSCNGLLLCRFTSGSIEPVSKKYCVCNPTTKQYRLIPNPKSTEQQSFIAGFSLAFDPSVSIHYEVLCMRQFRACVPCVNPCRVNLDGVPPDFELDRGFQMDIYSSENQTWRAFAYHFSSQRYINFEDGIFWNGAIHWNSGQMRSICFDLNAEKFIRIPMPQMPETDRWHSCRYFGRCLGHLHYIKISEFSAKKFCVLEMNNDYSKWFIKYRVSVSRLIAAFPEIVQITCERGFEEKGYAFSVLCVFTRIKEEDSTLVLAIPGKVISYNFTDKTVKALRELPGQFTGPLRYRDFNGVSAYPYIESLSSV